MANLGQVEQAIVRLGPRVMLVVSDTGHGVDAETLDAPESER